MQTVLYNADMDNYVNTIIPDGEYGKRGYLKDNYRIFKINDKTNTKFDFHYHEFDKIVFFLSGNVTYIIEGKEYILEPYDILLVRHGDIHKPIIDGSVNYDRVIIWANKDWLDRKCNLSHCFDETKNRQLNLIRPKYNERLRIFQLIEEMTAGSENLFADALYKDALFMQLMILINREKIGGAGYVSNKQIDNVIEYINNNLFSGLNVDKIAEELFISRYYLMHKFKEITGESVYSYISKKRLLYAADLLQDGASAKCACYESGYNDYSVFLKAFKKEFGITPANYKKQYRS